MAKPQLVTERDSIRLVIQRRRIAVAIEAKHGKPKVNKAARRIAALDPEVASVSEAVCAGLHPFELQWRCDGCGDSVHRAVHVGDVEDFYNSNRATLCLACIQEAHSVIDPAKENHG